MWLDVILAVLANFRLGELFALDDGPLDVFATLRGLTAYDRNGNKRQGALWASAKALFECPYCLGVWFAFPLALILSFGKKFSVERFLVLWLAIAGGQSFLQSLSGGSRE